MLSPAELNILVVADPSPEAEALLHLLHDEGYGAVHARNFDEALQLGRTRDPKIVFVSSTLPSPDCFAFCGMLKEDTHGPDLPVILLAREPTDELLARAWSAGYDDFIRCPLQRAEVLARLAWAVKNCNLREAAERLGTEQHELLDHSSEAFFFVEPQTLEILEANRRAAELADLPPGKLGGRPLLELLLLDRTELSRGQLMSLRPGKTLETADARLVSIEERVTRVSVSVRAITVGDERRLVVSCRDNPGRRELDSAIQRRNRELGALNQISTLVARTLDLDIILPELVDLTMSAVRAEGLVVCLVHKDDLAPKAQGGVLGPLAPEMAEAPADLPVRLCRPVARLGDPLVILTRAAGDARLGCQDVEALRLASYVGVPLRSEERLHGVLVAVTLDESGRLFDQENATLLTSIGTQLGMALGNARLYQDAHQRATIDALTQIPNRGAFMARLEDEVARALRYQRSLSLIMSDVNSFKQINDTRGHLVGDQALKLVGGFFGASSRHSDFPGRYGGDEFCILLPETPAAGAMPVAERIRDAVAGCAIEPENQEPLQITVSLGVAELSPAIRSADDFIAVADSALYQAKRGGANPFLAVTGAAEAATSG